MIPDPANALRLARETLDIEAEAISGLKARLNNGFARAVDMMLAVKGRVVVMGMGKSGHIGRKIAATLASTGTPAMFVHPAEASHGDLGMIKSVDLVLAVSNSGESEELTSILPVLKRQGVPLIAITGGAASTLARHADVTIDSGVDREACPLNLAPTASTTAQLALGEQVQVRIDAGPDSLRTIAGTITWIAPSAEFTPTVAANLDASGGRSGVGSASTFHCDSIREVCGATRSLSTKWTAATRATAGRNRRRPNSARARTSRVSR